MQTTELFGPQFKVIINMGGDLAKFYTLWGVILLTFNSVGCLIFSDLSDFKDFWAAFFLLFDYALGSWDTSIFCEEGIDSQRCWIGKIFTFIFLSVNMVLLLNLIIAILSSTYAYYEDKKIGLYYEVLVGKFTSMDYDEAFGAAACA